MRVCVCACVRVCARNLAESVHYHNEIIPEPPIILTTDYVYIYVCVCTCGVCVRVRVRARARARARVRVCDCVCARARAYVRECVLCGTVWCTPL